ncbi:hypothetical protein [Flavobacterium sp. TAB 87]|uniref:hypothetical protein n=1 Tax=Flavobacterium sp. TAB 87 TaxID=1729581 RepID=UPI00076CF677|nr:hypothetical protein [Flavobacterium sp. TAB 87]KVV14631.1 hypothetical protein AP058_01684 [Flavobacterium sp. TAB 87]
MQAINSTKLENLILVEEAKSLQNAGFIGKEQIEYIKKELDTPKTNTNILVRLGFVLLGLLLYVSICGAFSLLGISGIDNNWEVFLYLYAIIGVVGAEFLYAQNYFKHGLEEAFLLGSQLALGVAISEVFESDLLTAIVVAAVAILMYIRYLHILSMLIFCVALSVFLFLAMLEFGTIGKSILPFVSLLFSAGFYFWTKKLKGNLVKQYYREGILLANTFCLILFYLSCNYFVVRELSVVLLENEILSSTDIPFALFFYCFTIIVPILYLIQALKTKDKIMLWISFLAVAFSMYSFEIYFSALSGEIELTIAGLVLFGIAFFAIKKLKHNDIGITFKPDRITNSNQFLNAEALIVASTFGMRPEVSSESSMEFGGGDFSGGGAGGSF